MHPTHTQPSGSRVVPSGSGTTHEGRDLSGSRVHPPYGGGTTQSTQTLPPKTNPRTTPTGTTQRTAHLERNP